MDVLNRTFNETEDPAKNTASDLVSSSSSSRPASASAQKLVNQHFSVQGLTCNSCAEHLEKALGAVPGVQSLSVNPGAATVLVSYLPFENVIKKLEEAAVEAGYALKEQMGEVSHTSPDSIRQRQQLGLLLYPVCFGLLAAFGLVVFYLGVITVAQGWKHALEQLIEDKWFIAALVSGFGIQVALVLYLRNLHVRTSKGTVAASTGTSATAMLACCAHHLVDILPVAGLSGPTLFLNTYKIPLLWLGILINLAAITFMLFKIYQHQKRLSCPT